MLIGTTNLCIDGDHLHCVKKLGLCYWACILRQADSLLDESVVVYDFLEFLTYVATYVANS